LLTPDQWVKIEKLFESVENSPPEDRERLVYESGEDDSVRWEVLKMLQASQSGLLDINLRARPSSVYTPGETLAGGRFRIESLIAEGGMGEVYRAFDVDLQIPVALKTVHRILAHDDLAVERFKQEVHLARSINHPNVCRIFDLGKQTGPNGRDQYFLTMELLDGETLRALLDREKTLPKDRAFRIMEPVLQALSASHDRGILHRDLKPSPKAASGSSSPTSDSPRMPQSRIRATSSQPEPRLTWRPNSSAVTSRAQLRTCTPQGSCSTR
jgi:eukaryotic-like serine/threonine-protein kinase